MNSRSQDKNQYELAVIKSDQYLSQERNISESSFTIGDSKKLVTLT
ncbi:hypothetical protein [Spiroplasma endosymbiont of Polydrusus pterygomalis]